MMFLWLTSGFGFFGGFVFDFELVYFCWVFFFIFFFFLVTVMYCIVRKLGSTPAHPFLHGIALYVVEGKC